MVITGSRPRQCIKEQEAAFSWCPDSAQVAEHPWLATAQPLLSPLVVNDRVAEVTGADSYSHLAVNAHELLPTALLHRHCERCHNVPPSQPGGNSSHLV